MQVLHSAARQVLDRLGGISTTVAVQVGAFDKESDIEAVWNRYKEKVGIKQRQMRVLEEEDEEDSRRKTWASSPRKGSEPRIESAASDEALWV